MNEMIRQYWDELDETLTDLCREFRVRFAYPNSEAAAEVALTASRQRDENGELVLEIGVACSPRLRRALRGVSWSVYGDDGGLVCSGRTEHYSHFRLGRDHLDVGRDYRVEIKSVREPVVEPPPPVWTGTRLEFQMAGAAGQDESKIQKDDRDDVRFRAERLRGDSAGRTLIVLDLKDHLVGEGVFKFELRRGKSAGEEAVGAGFVGLYPLPGDEGWHTGEAVLNLTDAEKQEVAVGGDLNFCPSADNPCRLDRITPRDRALIEQALTQTLNFRCRKALQRVLDRLDAGKKDG